MKNTVISIVVLSLYLTACSTIPQVTIRNEPLFASTIAHDACRGVLVGTLTTTQVDQLMVSLDAATAMIDYLTGTVYDFTAIAKAVAAINPAVAPYASTVSMVMLMAAEQIPVETHEKAIVIARAAVDGCRAGIEEDRAGGVL